MGWVSKAVGLAVVAGAVVAVAPTARRQWAAVQGVDPGFRSPMAYLPMSFGPRSTQLMRRGSAPAAIAEGVALEVLTVAGEGGQPPVEVRVYRPAERRSAGALLWIHGGGYIIGSAAGDDTDASGLAARLGAVVVSVEYRLAPEHPFPAGLDDAVAAVRELQADGRTILLGSPSLLRQDNVRITKRASEWVDELRERAAVLLFGQHHKRSCRCLCFDRQIAHRCASDAVS